MKNLFLTFALGLITCISWAQNKSLILAPKYIPDINQNSPAIFLPTQTPTNNNPADGYDGQPAKSAQNIIVDNNNEIVFFIVDQYIYSKTGQLIDVFTSASFGLEDEFVTGSGSEITVVPAPNDCSTYYLFSTKEATGVTVRLGFYAKLVVKYGANNQLLPGSGLELSNTEECMHKGINFGSIPGLGSFFSSTNNVHDEAPRYAVVERANTNNKFLFIQNGNKLFRLKVDNNGISYDNYYIDFVVKFPNYSFIELLNSPLELEIVLMSNGNYRVAFAMDEVSTSVSMGSKGVFMFDLDNNGVLIPTTEKYANYPIINSTIQSPFVIKGIELSSDGSKLYVSHMSDATYPSSLDVFDLSTANPVKTVLEATSIFQHSQIEASFGNTLLIPHANGIARITNANGTPSVNMGYLSFPFPLPSLPSGTFDDRLRLLQDQIDGMNYSFISTNTYGASVFNTTAANQTWTPNGNGAGNPLINGTGNVAYIKDELRIKAGTTLTIQNMVIRFAPGARVVVENSTTFVQGGKLILNNTTLSNEDRCGPDELWLGVEVWGNQTQSQGSVFNSKQGRLIMNNASKIENAWIGALVGKRNSYIVELPFLAGDCNDAAYIMDEVVYPSSFDNARNGGIVQATNAIFSNNPRGVYFRPYFGQGGVNNRSIFIKTRFEWDGILKENAVLRELAKLEQVKGISFSGCEFINVDPSVYSIYQLGYGIVAKESQFYVSPKCNVLVQVGQPCPSQTVPVFQNLRFGIHTTNANGMSFTCKEAKFINNQYGIYVKGTENEKVLQNTFEIREANNYQSAGLVMHSSTAYQVEANEFYEYDDPLVANGTGRSYGIVVNNSGVEFNKIYRNRFHNLKIGGQTERKNASEITDTDNPGETYKLDGLHWRCNDFQSAIVAHDLTVMQGSMGYHQGYPSGSDTEIEAKQKAALNKFSLTGEAFADAHDLFVSSTSQDFEYIYIDAPRHKPDSYTPNLVDINDVLFDALPITTDDNTCPSTLTSKLPLVGKNEMARLKEVIASKKELLDKGAAEALLEVIENGNNEVVKNALLAASPYLSDKVLLAYIASNPPSGHLKQVMIANSQLSDEVKTALSRMNLPNGIANQIASKQNGLSKRTETYYDINYLRSQYEEIYNERIRDALLDESEEANFDNLISILKEEGDAERLKLLLSTYIVTKDDVNVQETKEELMNLESETEFLELAIIQEEISEKPAISEALETDVTIVTRLEHIKNNGSDKRICEKANCILELIQEAQEEPEFLRENTNRTMVVTPEENLEIDLYRAFNVHVYPNPSTGMVTFDYRQQEDSELKIEVVDLSGKIIYTTVFSGINGQQIDLRALDKGMYVVRILMDDVFIESQKLKLQ